MTPSKKGPLAAAKKPRKPRTGGSIRKADLDPKDKRNDWRWKFLDGLAKTCSPYAAAEAAGVSAKTAYRHRAKFPVFRDRWEEALEKGIQLLEVVVRQRALDRGDPASATLAIFLLKSHRPEVYRDRPPRDEAEIQRRGVELAVRLSDEALKVVREEFGEEGYRRFFERLDSRKVGDRQDASAENRARGRADVDWSDSQEVDRWVERNGPWKGGERDPSDDGGGGPS